MKGLNAAIQADPTLAIPACHCVGRGRSLGWVTHPEAAQQLAAQGIKLNVWELVRRRVCEVCHEPNDYDDPHDVGIRGAPDRLYRLAPVEVLKALSVELLLKRGSPEVEEEHA